MLLIQSSAATLLVLVAAAFAAAGMFKLFGSGAPLAARRSAFGHLLGADRAVPVFRGIGAVELTLSAVLLLPATRPGAAILASVWCVGMIGYLAYARWRAPDSSCGCLSATAAPISARTITRAVLLMLAAAGSITVDGPWPLALSGSLIISAATLVAGAALFVVLSPELDAHWLLPLRTLRVRWRHPLGDTAIETSTPMQASLQQLYRSPAYQESHDLIRSALLDTWDAGEWRLLTFAAGSGQRRATAVFAVPRLCHDPEQVRLAVVN